MAEKLLPAGVSIVDTSEAGALVPEFKIKIEQLNLLKRGDMVRALLKFPVPTSAEASGTKVDTEFVTGVVTGKTSSGLIHCKVFSLPDKTRFHSVDYSDELTLKESHILSHESSTEQVIADLEAFLTGIVPQPIPINVEDAKLRAAAQSLPPIVPQAGRQYWTRNGTQVTVWTYQSRKISLCGACKRQMLGSNLINEMCPTTRTYHSWQETDYSVWLGGTPDGAAIEWNANGAHAGGVRDLDLVKDLNANEVVA